MALSLAQTNPFAAPTSTPISAPSDVIEFDGSAEATYKGLSLWCREMRRVHSSAIARHRYPNVPGQTIEPLGREPISLELETVWFGEDWKDRLENLIFLKDSEQTSGTLKLPDGRGQFEAFLLSLSETVDLTMDGASVTLTFEEDAHVDAYYVASTDELAAAEAAIPDEDAETVGTDFAEYSGLVTATDEPPTLETFAALQTLETSIVAAQAECTADDLDSVTRYLALSRVRFRARRAFPDDDFLLASL